MDHPTLVSILPPEQRAHLERQMRASWLQKHGLSDPPRPGAWIGPFERFWSRATGIPVANRRVKGEQLPRGMDAVLTAAQIVLPEGPRRFYLNPQDHAEVFAREGAEAVYTAQPYFNDRLEDLLILDAAWKAKATRYGLRFTLSLEDSWHFLGHTVLLALWIDDPALLTGEKDP